MRRTGAITQKVPTFSSDDYRTFMIGDFKGIDKSVNPFNAIKSSAEECLNLYVDDEGTLTTRPRIEFEFDIPPAYGKIQKHSVLHIKMYIIMPVCVIKIRKIIPDG